jgi:type I restriction enzyme S subunit
MTKIRKFKITTPPLKEQKAIAEVLTDTDDLITSLQELIEKKEKIKKGAMQKLLTGEERLPGFDEEWEETCLGDIGITYGGLRSKRKKDFVDGNKKYIPFLNIINNVRIDIDKLDNVVVNNNENQNKAEYGDMFFNTSSETPEEVGMCAVLDEYIEELYLNSFCFGYRIYNREKYSPILIAYYLRSDLGRSIFSTIAQGATRYNLSKKLFNKIKILLPGIKEQKAIAQILSDMDSEIEALNKKLNKYKEIKQGMMEELLTGRIRLV